MKSFRKIFSCIFFLILFLSNHFAQGSLLTPEEMRTKYAVPESPAFNILNISPSNIMKPASVKEIALSASDFLAQDEKISLPQSFAIEFSPALLLNGKNLSVEEYQNSAWLYRLRLSLATNRPDGESTASELGFGIRITLQDDSDFRTNDKFLNDAQICTDQMISVLDSMKIVLVKAGKIDKLATIDEVEKHPEVESIIDSLSTQFTQKWPTDKWSEQNWNANISEVAFAVKTTSKDSLARNLIFSKLSFWYSSAYSISDWGQFLFGAFCNYEKNFLLNKFITTGSFGLRFYAGTNDIKIYLETQGSILQDLNPEWLLNSGLELKIQGNIWADFTAGFKSGNEFDKNGSLVTDFKLKYGI